MKNEINSGHGIGESGLFRAQTGIPIDACHWPRVYDEEQESLITENRF